MSSIKSNEGLYSILTMVNSMIEESGLSIATNTKISLDSSNIFSKYNVQNMFQFKPKNLHYNASNESLNNQDDIWYTPRQDFEPELQHSEIISHNSYLNEITEFEIENQNNKTTKMNLNIALNSTTFNTANKIQRQRSMYISKVLRKYYKKINKTYKLDYIHNVAQKMKTSTKRYTKPQSSLLKKQKLFDESIPIEKSDSEMNTVKSRKNYTMKSKLPRYIGNIQTKSEVILSENDDDNLNKQLLIERKKREEFEKIVIDSQIKINESALQFSIVEKLKNSALESSKMYQQELYKLKKEHQSTVIQLEIVKHENAVLSKRLESKMQEHEGALLSNDHTSQQHVPTCGNQQLFVFNNRHNLLDLLKQLNAEKKLTTAMKIERKRVLTELNNLENQLKKIRQKCELLNVELQKIKSKEDDNLHKKKELHGKIGLLEEKVTNILKYRENYFKKTIEFLETETLEKFKFIIELHERCCDLENRLKHHNEEDKIKLQNIESEVAKVSKIINNEIRISTEEKSEMLNIIRNLKQVTQDYKKKINELESNKQQQEIINDQKLKLADRDEKIKCKLQIFELQRKEKIIYEQKCELDEINERNKELNASLCDKDALLKQNNELILKLQKHLEDMKVEWRKEREDSLVKNKIIDDQISTIQKLKHDYNGIKTNEICQLYSELELAQRTFALEQKRYDTVVANLLDAKRKNKKLTLDLQKVINQIAKYDSNEHNVINVEILTELENKVIEKCKEWQTQKNILINEKNEAILAARYATQKFIDTVLDIQKQTESQKIAQQTLTILVTERQKQFEIQQQELIFNIPSL